MVHPFHFSYPIITRNFGVVAYGNYTKVSEGACGQLKQNQIGTLRSFRKGRSYLNKKSPAKNSQAFLLFLIEDPSISYRKSTTSTPGYFLGSKLNVASVRFVLGVKFVISYV